MDSSIRFEFEDILAEFAKQVDLSPYLSSKEFNDLYRIGSLKDGLSSYRDLTFYQASYYLRFNSNDDGSRHHLVVVEEGMEEDFKNYVKEVNAQVKDLYEEFIRTSVDPHDEDTFRYWYRVGVDFGICHFTLMERNGYMEALEEMEASQDYYDESCSRCRGGGCPMCEPWRFI